MGEMGGKAYSRKEVEGFPGDPGAKNLPANAGDMGSIFGLGRSHMLQGSLSPCAMSTEACALEPLLQKRSHQNEKSKSCN